jgi:hypothetical protein
MGKKPADSPAMLEVVQQSETGFNGNVSEG